MNNICFFTGYTVFVALGNIVDIACSIVKILKGFWKNVIISFIRFIFKILDLSCIQQKGKGNAFNVNLSTSVIKYCLLFFKNF